jgi:tryptophanyl-tRNA synthetase
LERWRVARVFSGIQPTGAKHLGNDLGAIRGWVAEQERNECFFCLVDLHALSAQPDPAALREDTRRLAALLLAAGVDPGRATLFVQSHVPAHTELSWILSSLARVGELRRMTQFKAKADEQEGASAALFTYPLLQAADVLLYRAERVPVGADQRQHLELARTLATRFNRRYGEVFVLPEAVLPSDGARVMDLQAPERKMSTSGGTPLGTLLLLDTPDVIRRKVRAAVTDPGGEVRADPGKPGVSNLLEILAAVSRTSVGDLESRLEGRGYAALKDEVAEAVVAHLAPIQARYTELIADGMGQVDEALARGADRARAVAAETLAPVRAAVGLLPPPERG